MIKIFLEKLQIYGVFGLLRLQIDFVLTRLFFPKARIVRSPKYIRGRHSIDFGSKLTTGVGVRLDAFPVEKNKIVIHFGHNVQLNDYVHIGAIEKIQIGDDVLIASRVFISDHNHGRFDGNSLLDSPDTPPDQRPLFAKSVYIGHRVWIGENVCIMPGVSIGDGAVIGAGAVVTKDIPATALAVGNPARVIRIFNPINQTWDRV